MLTQKTPTPGSQADTLFMRVTGGQTRCVALRHLMLSSSCRRIALAIAPDTPTPQHRFADPQKLATGFQLAFSRTGPKTVSCSPLPVVRFGGEHNVLSLHTHHRSSQDCTCRPAVAMSDVKLCMDIVRDCSTDVTLCHFCHIMGA